MHKDDIYLNSQPSTHSPLSIRLPWNNISRIVYLLRQILQRGCGTLPTGGDTMPREYLILFNAILDALDVLIKGMQDAEEEVIK
jgi:hypothetical protein